MSPEGNPVDEEAPKHTAEVLDELSTPSHVQIRSSSDLVDNVAHAASADDEKRVEDGRDRMRRRTGYRQVRGVARSLTHTPWQVIHAIGLGTALARQGAGRGLAEHWGSLRYSQALAGNRGGYLQLSPEGRDLLRFYKAAQSGEIGTGFASLVAERIVRSRYPDHSVSLIPADIALKAGWSLRTMGKGPRPEPLQRRPHFFVEAWRPGHPSKVLLVASKGTHGTASQVHKQLATATAHVEAVHVGAHGAVPFLLVGTEIPAKESLAVHVLEAPAETVLEPYPGQPRADLDLVLEDRNEPADVNVVHERNNERTVPGFQVRPESFNWFSIVLARAEAATLMAFTGGGKPTAQYLTNEQGRRHFRHDNQAGTGSVRDARHRIHGIDFVGTDHVFRLNGNRVEAFSGLAEDLYEHLRHGRVSDYRADVHALRAQWPVSYTAKEWGPVSVRPDGSVMAIRLLNT
ncbi:hypothetical protein ABZV41_23485 [Streptomyces sp. NPDC005098]|uniref:hypothetical protein n=1 Tax=Streptomyces sp. NPDC005098 TaxID=3154560 RepID=UPI0033BD635B